MKSKQNWRREFGKSEPGAKKTWDDFHRNAEYERFTMMGEFTAWARTKRHKTEDQILNAERFMAAAEPFARAGINNAETPADVPLVVLEFTDMVLELMELKRKMALLDHYYKQNGNWGDGQEYLEVNPGDEAEINALWDWFIEERDEEKEKSEK